jgi:hypothetical protein
MYTPRQVLAVSTLALLPLSLIVADTTTAPATTKKKSTAKKGSSTAKKGTTTGKRATSAKGRTTASRPPAHTRQVQPTPERYKEIQQALAGKGYLKTEPSGTWNQESVEALRRFQEDQNITASGKIDSLSLIALGLGPKRTTSAVQPAPSEPPELKPEAPAPAAN